MLAVRVSIHWMTHLGLFEPPARPTFSTQFGSASAFRRVLALLALSVAVDTRSSVTLLMDTVSDPNVYTLILGVPPPCRGLVLWALAQWTYVSVALLTGTVWCLYSWGTHVGVPLPFSLKRPMVCITFQRFQRVAVDICFHVTLPTCGHSYVRVPLLCRFYGSASFRRRVSDVTPLFSGLLLWSGKVGVPPNHPVLPRRPLTH